MPVSKIEKKLTRIQKNKYQNFVIYFYIYSFLGWIVDVLICLISDGVLENRGFLFEPICPMYGFAALILLVTLSSKKKNTIIDFIKAIIICTVFEYMTSLVLEVIFHIRWWDYSKEYFNLKGRVCFAASIFWGMLSVLFIREIHPFIKRKVKKSFSKIKKEKRICLTKIVLIITFLDFILSIFKYVIIC